MDDAGNWLHGEQVACPACQQALYRVDHSPFYDEVFLYCDRCPMHVEVSYYDPVYERVVEAVPRGEERMRALEALLKPCACGGSFRHDAPRRCLTCHAPVIVANPAGVDLFFWSDLILPNAGDHTTEEYEAEEQRHAPFARTGDLWREP